MRGAGVAGALAALALAGCGGAAETPTPVESRVAGGEPMAADAPAELTGRVSGQGAAVSDPSAAGGGLTGRVSALNATVSGLNTRITDTSTIIDLPADALFEFDKATLTPDAEAQLKKAAELIRASPAGAIGVIGHTDSKGDDAYNQRLSEARAKTVADWFGGQVGVRTRSFQVSGKGESAPVAPNAQPDGEDDPAGRTKNRRVEVVVPRA